ncbi:MAG: sialate O-acetylesterase [Planctomycetota bacterium]|nr:MAG: sialate O-acetylesterase [Planctomycetota bacterium]
MRISSKFFSWAVLLGAVTAAQTAMADVRVPNIFSDHMVLQRDQPNKVWGKADAGESVTVSIGDAVKQTTADADGNWSVMLDPLAVGQPRTLTVSCDHNKVVIKDVLVGEVWICSGQSNMEWRVNNVNDPDLVKATARFPKIRMINYPNTGSQEPIWTHPDANWMVCSPETVGDFSGVGYFFGLQLHQALGVPVGLINNAWGGSAADAWINRDLLEADPVYKPTMDRWKQMEAQYAALSAKSELTQAEQRQLAQLKRQMTGNQRPGNIYNGVLKSHLGYGIRGAIWYQGESNASRAYQYRHIFPKMIQNWRDEWGAGDFPFYWVQLADFRAEKPEPSESDWAELREAQTMTMSKLPHTGQAVIIDVGEGKDIHPRNKLTVGQRLSRWALAHDYGFDVAAASPMYKSMEKKGDRIILSFEHVHGGFRPFDVNEPIGFAIAGQDRKFVWAKAKIVDGNRIEVSSPDVPDPVAVRYAWADNPVCNMYDQLGLPLTPFRTDDWPGITVNNY